MMRLLMFLGMVSFVMHEITCPPVQPDLKPVEGASPDEDREEDPVDSSEENGEEDQGFGLEYDRYLKEIVVALEEDESFRKKLEEMNMTDIKALGLEYDRYLSEIISALEEDETFRNRLESMNTSDIKNGKIAMHLDLVSHQIRERLDEIKRQEMNRLRMLAKQKMQQMNGIQKMDENYLHHVDIKNPHSFEAKDLEKLIRKATSDLDEIDKKRRGEFKAYEMEKEHERREGLKNLDDEKRKAREEEYEQMKTRHQDHPKVHHPGSKDQLEDVWEKTDHMDSSDFDPKTFFKLHDIDGNGFLDQDEVEALFQKELDQVYDPTVPEDDMRERYEDMARMREHVFGELDQDKDRLISLQEFLNYTASQEFQKDDGWKTVDEEENFTNDEYEKYEQMLREHEERMRAQGMDSNMVQPGVVPLGQDPNVQHMQMPQGGQGMPHQQQQFDQQQFQQHNQQQQQFQQQGQEQQFQQHEQQQQMRQMGQMQGHAPTGQVHDGPMMGQGHMQGGPPAMGQGQMQGGPQGMGHGDMRGGPPAMGQGQMQGGPQGMGHGRMQGGPPAMGQGQMQGGPPAVGQGQMPPGQMPQGQGRHIPRPPPNEMGLGKGQIKIANVAVNQAVPVSDGQGQAQVIHGQGQVMQGQDQVIQSPGHAPVMHGQGQAQVVQGQAQTMHGQSAPVHDSPGQQQQGEAPVDTEVPVQDTQRSQGEDTADTGVPVQNVKPQEEVPVDTGVPVQSDLAQGQPVQQHVNTAQEQNINNEQVIKVEALGRPSPEKLRQNSQAGIPPVQGHVPQQQQQQANAQQQGQQQGQDLKFEGAGQHEEPRQPLV